MTFSPVRSTVIFLGQNSLEARPGFALSSPLIISDCQPLGCRPENTKPVERPWWWEAEALIRVLHLSGKLYLWDLTNSASSASLLQLWIAFMRNLALNQGCGHCCSLHGHLSHSRLDFWGTWIKIYSSQLTSLNPMLSSTRCSAMCIHLTVYDILFQALRNVPFGEIVLWSFEDHH